MPNAATHEFRSARDLLLQHRDDQERARAEFAWPRPDHFNWALDHFDVAAGEHPDRPALRIVGDGGAETRCTYHELSQRSNQVANWLIGQGVHPGDRVLVMLGNQVELWETLLAAVKLGAVLVPAPPLLTEEDLVDRIGRGEVDHVVAGAAETPKFAAVPGHWTKISVGYMDGWLPYTDSEYAGLDFAPPRQTLPDDPLLLYFTSGTASRPKLVEHSHLSYPVGHLTTMYWAGIRPGDVHLNISSPGWAKHAYSSVFAPWNAQATVLAVNQARFDAARLLDEIVRCGVDTFCAPPTVWRMLVQAGPGEWDVPLREAVSAGEPLNPEVVERIRRAWGLTVRDGFGQTETTLVIGNGPGQEVVPGSMGRAMPGYDVVLEDPVTGEPADRGEICLDLGDDPVGVMSGYRDSAGHSGKAVHGGRYHTGDIASRDSRGYITYIGRADDVFKASDYRISPFEIENVLLEHEFVAEAAVVPSPDPLRLAVPKAYVSLAEGVAPEAETARAILVHARERLAPYKRVRRLEFSDLPKTMSGKIRRSRLRAAESERGGGRERDRPSREYWEEDFPGLKD